MDWELILQLIITSIIAPCFILATKELIGWLKLKADSVADENIRQALNSALDNLDKSVLLAVAETEQTFVSALKDEGKFDGAAAKQAAQMALDKTKTIMSNYAMETIEAATGTVEDIIRARIEKAVLSGETGGW